jgi:hypothetical protein
MLTDAVCGSTKMIFFFGIFLLSFTDLGSMEISYPNRDRCIAPQTSGRCRKDAIVDCYYCDQHLERLGVHHRADATHWAQRTHLCIGVTKAKKLCMKRKIDGFDYCTHHLELMFTGESAEGHDNAVVPVRNDTHHDHHDHNLVDVFRFFVHDMRKALEEDIDLSAVNKIIDHSEDCNMEDEVPGEIPQPPEHKIQNMKQTLQKVRRDAVKKAQEEVDRYVLQLEQLERSGPTYSRMLEAEYIEKATKLFQEKEGMEKFKHNTGLQKTLCTVVATPPYRCPICLNNDSVGVLLPCGHAIHFDCFHTMLSKSKVPSCPCCRRNVLMNS